MNTPQDVLDKLADNNFEALIGTAESVWIDAKEKPYTLDNTKQRLELAKDVTAMANAVGGIIVIGFNTIRNPTTAGERISEVKQFPVNLVDVDRYKKILREYVHPSVDIQVRVFESTGGKGVAAILVQSSAGKPYIVSKVVDDQGQNIGAYFGFFERKDDVIPSLSVARIQQQLANGQQWASIEQRLQGIETSIASWGTNGPPAKPMAISDEVRKERLKDARIALGRNDAPLIYYMADPAGGCDFPTLFRSRAERVVRLIERPPRLREHGFDVRAGDMSEIIQGRLRRCMLAGHYLIELWKDGLFIFIAPGDEGFLGWRMDAPDRPIHINNFVLAESLLTFCWLIRFIYAEAEPKPQALRLTVGCDNLTRTSGHATLSTAPEGTPDFCSPRPAPGPSLEVFQMADFAHYEAERLAYLLMADIYNWFTWEAVDVPYIDRKDLKPKLRVDQIIGGALPWDLPTPDYS